MYAGKPVRGLSGELVCVKPFPSMPTHFWNDADGKKYRNAYFNKFPGEAFWTKITCVTLWYLFICMTLFETDNILTFALT